MQSETEINISQWLANDSAALRGMTELCLQKAAHQLAIDLVQFTPGKASVKERAPSRYSTSCDDVPAQWERLAAQPPSAPPAPATSAPGTPAPTTSAPTTPAPTTPAPTTPALEAPAPMPAPAVASATAP